MAPWPVFVVAGAAIGTFLGLFGVGGSSIATPLLSLLGLPGLLAVASPLPATVPAALVAAWPYLRNREARPRAAGWSILGGVPGTIGGALLSEVVGGRALLVASGFVLMIVGLRVIRPIDEATRHAGTERGKNRPLLVATAAGIGLFTGQLANGGGFLLVPAYLLVFGLTMRQAVGTSLLVHRRAVHPHAGHALGTGPHRLVGGGRAGARRRAGQCAQRAARPSARGTHVALRVRLVPHLELRGLRRLPCRPGLTGLLPVVVAAAASGRTIEAKDLAARLGAGWSPRVVDVPSPSPGACRFGGGLVPCRVRL